MEAVAKLNNERIAPRKMRMVADLIRGEKVDRALNILKFHKKHAAPKLEKLLLSAIANWQVKNEDVDLEEAELFVKIITVDGGRVLKRLRPAPQGRAHRIRKRTNHVTIVVDSLVPVEEKAPKAKKEDKKADKSETKAKAKTEKVEAKESKKSTSPKKKPEQSAGEEKETDKKDK